jgi:hypothetical protein
MTSCRSKYTETPSRTRSFIRNATLSVIAGNPPAEAVIVQSFGVFLRPRTAHRHVHVTVQEFLNTCARIPALASYFLSSCCEMAVSVSRLTLLRLKVSMCRSEDSTFLTSRRVPECRHITTRYETELRLDRQPLRDIYRKRWRCSCNRKLTSIENESR